MKNKEIARRVKYFRSRKGLTQEELAEKSGLSDRTIQRIENGETEPRGDSLKKLSKALEVSPDEILDWQLVEDKNILIGLCLSQLVFLVFPLLGIIIPLVIWVIKKNKIKNVDRFGKTILIFQLVWNILFFSTNVYFAWKFIEVGVSADGNIMSNIKFTFPIFYVINLLFILINFVMIRKEKKINLRPSL